MMIDLVKFGNKIAALRKERGYTGEELAERLHVSPQEFFILEAVYTDGQTMIPVTRLVNDMVRGNMLNIYVNTPFIGVSIESDRLKILTVKFQTPKGIYYAYAIQNENLILDKESVCFASDKPFQLIGAYYGNEKKYSSAMQKMEHYEYFKWDEIAVNHENFPSNTSSDDTEYLTLIYLNADGIHTLSCPENKNHYIMGISGACYRICFTDVWDYSCTDALVAFDYATPLYKAVGYSFRTVERLEKQERKAERLAIMEDIQRGKPVLAINLRVAPEWGIITGYTDNGNRFLCRTYFDKDVLDALEQKDCQNSEDKQVVFDENEGYLFNDYWPFIIMHFGEKVDVPSPRDTLKNSLALLVSSFNAGECRGYHQGKEAYKAWIKGLLKEDDFRIESDRENVLRRLSVNDSMLCNLLDSRHAAASYLSTSIYLTTENESVYLAKIAENCQVISDMVYAFLEKVRNSSTCATDYNTVNAFVVSTTDLREEQVNMLEAALALDEESCRLAELILKRG